MLPYQIVCGFCFINNFFFFTSAETVIKTNAISSCFPESQLNLGDPQHEVCSSLAEMANIRLHTVKCKQGVLSSSPWDHEFLSDSETEGFTVTNRAAVGGKAAF